jgi:diadenosine tetraphosphate (Ap4A) HIT family hydrolase
MENCIFCHIVAGIAPAYTIYEDDDYLAFLDMYPFGEGHTQVIPKKHYPHIWDMEKPGDLFTFAAKIADHYRHLYHTSSCFSLIIEEGVPHAHLHLLPASKDTMNRYFPALRNLRQPKLDASVAKSLQAKLKLP